MAIGTPSESPAIVVKEVDLSGVVPNVQSTTGAFGGVFRWGPGEEATLVSNEAELASKFGNPNDDNAQDFLTAAYFLKYSNSLQISRVTDAGAKNAADSAGAATLILNDPKWEQGTFSASKIYAKYPGAIGNSLQVVSTGAVGWTGWTAAYKAQFDGAPTGNESHVLVLDQDGVITGTAGSVLERYPFVSVSSTATKSDGSSNYMKEVINRSSSYIRMSTHIDSGTSTSLLGGDDNLTGIGTDDYLRAFDKFEDKDTIQLDFLIAPGQASTTPNSTIVNDLIGTAVARKDCVVAASPAKDDVVGQADPVTNSVEDANAFTFSSYAVVDNNWLKVYDKYNDKYRYIPAASSTAGLMAAADAEAAPWFSPAGPRRGALLGVTALAYTPTKAERDTLYKASINPIANLPGQGVMLFGDKTHMNRPSAFDRINVRRLFNVIERAIALAARNTLFELNDEFTRAEFVNIVEPFLREIKGRRGITDFRVVCDETNNTAAVIDRNEFVANIFIKPARSINYITLNFVAVRSGVDFEEVAGLSV